MCLWVTEDTGSRVERLSQFSYLFADIENVGILLFPLMHVNSLIIFNDISIYISNFFPENVYFS